MTSYEKKTYVEDTTEGTMTEHQAIPGLKDLILKNDSKASL